MDGFVWLGGDLGRVTVCSSSSTSTRWLKLGTQTGNKQSLRGCWKLVWLQRWITAALTWTVTPGMSRDSSWGQGDTSRTVIWTPGLRLICFLPCLVEPMMYLRSEIEDYLVFLSSIFCYLPFIPNHSHRAASGRYRVSNNYNKQWEERSTKTDLILQTEQGKGYISARLKSYQNKSSFIQVHQLHFLFMLVEPWFMARSCLNTGLLV